ncbi:MAG: rRNA maturation RNase YbeY [Treponemataceae bacterium]|nr:rRNA maturation RNase YbeY [Treponemataceae bacterium]
MKNEIFVEMEETCEAPSWFDNVKPFVTKVLDNLEKDHWELSVLFCNDKFIWDLNRQYRQIDNPTDVLSFEQGDEYTDENDETWFTAGDIVISLDTLKTNCTEFGVTENEELKRLLIHGVLHLSGMDHSDNSPEQPMLKFQEEILAKMAGDNII